MAYKNRETTIALKTVLNSLAGSPWLLRPTRLPFLLDLTYGGDCRAPYFASEPAPAKAANFVRWNQASKPSCSYGAPRQTVQHAVDDDCSLTKVDGGLQELLCRCQ